jgi:putative glutamine amidotransferase
MNPSKPIIGITSSLTKHGENMSVHLNQAYILAVQNAGGIPIVIPISVQDEAHDLVSLCDGILLSGGEDIDPLTYGANPEPEIGKTILERDQIEKAVIKMAQKQGKPILGICRGIAMINATLGGTIIQDIEKINPDALNHRQTAARSQPTHDLTIEPNSRLCEIIGEKEIQINSMHHQAIKQTASTLRVVAKAPDGTIEALELIDRNKPMLIAVQWHPEEMASEDPKMANLFKALIDESSHIRKTNDSF